MKKMMEQPTAPVETFPFIVKQSYKDTIDRSAFRGGASLDAIRTKLAVASQKISPGAVKQNIIDYGNNYSGFLDIAAGGTAGIVSSAQTLSQFFAHNPVFYSDVLIAAALLTWAVNAIAYMALPRAVKDPTGPISDEERDRLNHKIKIRNSFYAVAAYANTAASVAFGLGGAMIGNVNVAIAGTFYTGSVIPRLVFKEGREEITRPVHAQGTPWRTRALDRAKYEWAYRKNHPNKLAEPLLIAGLIFSCCGMVQYLPWQAALPVVIGHGAAAIIRNYTAAMQQKIVQENVVAFPVDGKEAKDQQSMSTPGRASVRRGIVAMRHRPKM